MTQAETPAQTSEVYPDKWGGEPATPTVRGFHAAIRARAAEKLRRDGRRWEEVVFDPEFLLTVEEFAEVEAELLATGYRFDHSAQISLVENPEKYKARATRDAEAEKALAGASQAEVMEGEVVIGYGDNALSLDHDVEGVARFVSTVETVMSMAVDGVPPDTIAVIEDAGGTLTAPILEGFTGVLCKGGTIKSHLGVLSREYRIPCLMGVELTGALNEGDRMRIESTKQPPAYSAEAAKAVRANERARIWRLGS